MREVDMDVSVSEESSQGPFDSAYKDYALSMGMDNKNPVTCHLLLSLLDEACFMIRSLNLVLGEKLEIPKNLVEIVNTFERQRVGLTKNQPASGVDTFEEETKLALSTWQLCRMLSSHKAFEKDVKSSMENPSVALSFFQQALQKFRTVVLKRLTISLEEETAIQAYNTEVFHRKERASKDHANLVEQLQGERKARENALSQHQEIEHHLQQELQQVKDQDSSLQQQLRIDFDTLEEQELISFLDQETKLATEAGQLKILLEKMQVENRELELTLHGKKEQSAEEVTNLLHECDQDIAQRITKLQQLTDTHKVVDEKVKFYQAYFEERELQERKRKDEERLCAELKVKEAAKMEEATLLIQRAWRKYLAQKLQEETQKKEQKQGKKGKSKSPKGKGKKSKGISKEKDNKITEKKGKLKKK